MPALQEQSGVREAQETVPQVSREIGVGNLPARRFCSSPQRVTPNGRLMHQTELLFLLCRRPLLGGPGSGTADYDSGSEASKQSGELVRVRVNEQKVQQKRAEVNITQRDQRTALNLVPLLPGGGTNDPAFQPFSEEAGATWQRMRTLLRRLVEPLDKKLWEVANEKTQLGSHEFRRNAMDVIDSSADPTKKDAMVRGLGADRAMADRVYRDARKDSYERTQLVRENIYGAGLAAPARAPAAATATSTHGQPAVNKGVTSRSQEEAEAQAHLTLEFNRESWHISDDESFYRVFEEYRKGGKVDRQAMESFSDHHGGKNFLVRLSSLCRVSREGLLPLPLPWDWLEKSVPLKVRGRAMVAYGHLLGFLEDLLERHGHKHMSKEEVEFRRQHLRVIKSEVLRAREQARK